MGNNALQVNSVVGPQADLAITTHGSDWYFTVTAIMGVSTLTVMGLALTKPHTQRLFHYISALLLLVASIAYFSMGSGLGQVPIEAEFTRLGTITKAAGSREIFYARYIDWFVTTPLLLLDLMLTAAMPWPSIAITILADEVMIVCGLVGALTQTTYKWGYWVFGMVALFYVAYSLCWDGLRQAKNLGGAVHSTYLRCGVLTIFLWFLYPIAWGVSEGGNVIHPDSEAVFYGVLDIFAKPVFTFLLLWGHKNIDIATLGLYPGLAQGVVREKNGLHGVHHGNGAQDGVTGNGAGATAAAAPGATTGATTTGHDAV